LTTPIQRLTAIAAAALLIGVVVVLTVDVLRHKDRAGEDISVAYNAGDDAAVIERVDRTLQGQAISSDNVSLLFWKAESQYRSGQADAAIATYLDAIAKVESVTNNITRREFVETYFRFAALLREKGRFERAIAVAEAGLRVQPQNVAGQIFLGQLLDDSGQHDRALAHYQKLLASSVPVSEERAVLAMKVARLSSGAAARSSGTGEDSSPLYRGLSIGLVPINRTPPGVSLEDVCAVLEATWRVRCEVLPAVDVPPEGLWVSDREQYDGDALLEDITRRLPWPARRHTHIVGITEYDIFGPDTSFVFSWQRHNEAHAEAVLSTSRLVADIPTYYEPEIIATRRVAIQALSTTGRMFGFERPTDAECPLAYPESLREFQLKQLRLCASEEEQRDALLRRRGGETAPAGRARAEAIARVRHRYFIE
jgi:predicted Zn-dependent protease